MGLFFAYANSVGLPRTDGKTLTWKNQIIHKLWLFAVKWSVFACRCYASFSATNRKCVGLWCMCGQMHAKKMPFYLRKKGNPQAVTMFDISAFVFLIVCITNDK